MKEQRLAKVSPWILAAACGLLAIIISAFAVNNYHREKKLMTEVLLQRGLTIYRFVVSSSLTSLRNDFKNFQMAEWQWTDHVQLAINNSVDQPGLLFIGLIDQNNRIVAATEKNDAVTEVDDATSQFCQLLFKENDGEAPYIYRKTVKDSKSIFQIAVSYHPFGRRDFAPRPQGMGFRFGVRAKEQRFQRGWISRGNLEKLLDIQNQKYVLLLELDLNEFDKAVKRQLTQIVSLSLVLLLVGIGGWLSLLTLQGLKGSQESLRQIRAFNDILVSSLPVGLIAIDSEGKIRICNQSAEEMVGIDAEKILGKSPDGVLPVQLSDELQPREDSSNGVVQKEIVLSHGNLQPRSLMLATLQVVDNENNYAGKTLLIQDVSQIKKLQIELRRNERLAALGKVAAGVAHELRNPLSSIKGLAVLLKAKVCGDPEGNNTAEILVQEVERLNRSIGELLDYARPQKLRLEKTDLRDVLEKSVMLIEADIASAGIGLNTSYINDCFVLADQDKLIQVFLNLLLNSLQAMKSGGSIQISLHLEEKIAICKIDDEGCGLDEDSVAQVFDPYFTTKSDGTGLGLAMSAKIVEEHQGRIEFRSSVGQGTTVQVILPLYSGGS